MSAAGTEPISGTYISTSLGGPLLVIARETLSDRDWRVAVLPEGRPNISSKFDELERFLVVGGAPATIVPTGDMGYGYAATAEDSSSLRNLVQRTADDFVISSGRANLALAVSDAEVHVVVGDEDSLLRFVGGNAEQFAESVGFWIEAQRRYEIDHGVILELVRHYEPNLLDSMRFLAQ